MNDTTATPPAASPPEKPLYPYPDIETAIEDRFRSIGGFAQAHRFLRRGWQDTHWRRRVAHNARERAAIELAAAKKGRR